MSLVKQTIYLSLFAQFVALIIGFYTLTLKIPDYANVLKEVLGIENIVQLIEFLFYTWFSFFVTRNLDKFDMAKYRYYDWFFTTPIMLLSTMLYFDYTLESEKQQQKQNEQSYPGLQTELQSELQTELQSELQTELQTEQRDNTPKYNYNEWILPVFLRENRENVIKLVLSNMGMLLFGYLYEIGLLSIVWSTLIGFGFFFYTFYILYTYAQTQEAMNLFTFMFVVWAIYGIAPFFNYKIKNVMYNILDIFAKNVYGVFIAYKIYLLHSQTN
jgi:hypothetical protein